MIRKRRSPYIILSKSEWERLQRQSSPPEEPVKYETERVRALTEMSQEWIKSWPDTVAGHLALLEKQKKQQMKKEHQANVEFMKAYAKKAKQANTAEAIKRARQMIFEDSSYGRQLISALLESRATDVREAQIKLQKEIKEKTTNIVVEEKGLLDFYDNDAERVEKEKLKKFECNKINKEIIARKKEKEMQENLLEKQYVEEEEKVMKLVFEIENEERKDVKLCEKKKMEEFAADCKNNAIIKERDQKLADALTDVYKKEQDRIKLKSRAIFDKVYQGRPDTKWSKNVHDNLERLQHEENIQYENFINKGVKAYEKRISQIEASEKLKEKHKISSKYLSGQKQKTATAEQAYTYANKCVCDRQSLSLKNNEKITKKINAKSCEESLKKATIDNKPRVQQTYDRKAENLTFLEPRNNLTKALRKREKEPSPWNGTKAAHTQFAERADEVLKTIKHKYFARKVVDEYRRVNCLNDTSLQVPNY